MSPRQSVSQSHYNNGAPIDVLVSKLPLAQPHDRAMVRRLTAVVVAVVTPATGPGSGREDRRVRLTASPMIFRESRWCT